MVMKNLIVAQSGGPTAAINATLTGVIKEWCDENNGTKVYGSRFGVEGILKENIIDLTELSENDLDKLMCTPDINFQILMKMRLILRRFQKYLENMTLDILCTQVEMTLWIQFTDFLNILTKKE